MADVDIRGVIGKLAANMQRLADGSNSRSYPRLDALQELITPNPFNGLQQTAVEGTYYTGVQEGTRGTGVNFTVSTGTSYSATQALLVVSNTNAAGGPDVILDYFKMVIDTVITGGTLWKVYHAIDNGNRLSSGGANMTLTNADGVAAPAVTATSGVVVATAVTGAVKDLGFNVIANGVLVAGAELTLKYARQEGMTSGVFTLPTTAVASAVIDCPAVVIRPGQSYVLNEFQAARSATGVGEFAIGLMVR